MQTSKLLRTVAGEKGDKQARTVMDAVKAVKKKTANKTGSTAAFERKISHGCKTAILTVLFATSVSISAAGIVLTVLSFINKASFTVFQSQIPASVFGLIVVFLGIRYFLSVLKLKPELLKHENRFSWKNFKRENRT